MFMASLSARLLQKMAKSGAVSEFMTVLDIECVCVLLYVQCAVCIVCMCVWVCVGVCIE